MSAGPEMSSEHTAASVAPPSHRLVRQTPSATRGLMDRLLCDCGVAVAVLLCVATQVRPAHAYLQQFLPDLVMWSVPV